MQENKEFRTYCTCRSRCHSAKSCPCKAAHTCCSHLCHPQRTCVNCPSVQNASGCVTIDTDTIPDTRVPNSKTQWTRYGAVTLTSHHKKILQSNAEWLDDALVTATQNLLKQQYPLIGGFQATVLGESLAMEPQPGEFVQILCVRGNHWICASTVGCGPSTINIYDSLHGHLDNHT